MTPCSFRSFLETAGEWTRPPNLEKAGYWFRPQGESCFTVLVVARIQKGRRGGGEEGSTDSGHDASDPRELGRAGGEFGDKSADETANERGEDDVDRNKPPGQNGSSNEVTANGFLNLKKSRRVALMQTSSRLGTPMRT